MAGKKITVANLKAVLDGTEEIPLNDSGSDKKTTIQKIKDFASGILDSIKLNPSYEPTSTQVAEIWWNNKWHTLNLNTGLYNDIIKLGQDQFYVFYNNTGADIDPFKVMHLEGATSFDGELYPTFEFADPRDWEKVQGTLALSCCTIANGTLGVLIRSAAQITGGDTSAIPAGSQLWISNDGTGSITDVRPAFPDYSLSAGGNYNQVAVNGGKLFVNFTSSVDDDFHNAWDGGIRESFNFTTDSTDGIAVVGLLQNVNPLRNLTCFFSDVGRYTLDTTTAPLTIELTPGTDNNIQRNYIYVPIETKVLTLSTSGWPITEHCRVALCEVQSAATTQTDGGVLANQNTNDHIKKESDNGHILHIAAWIRKQFSTWESGSEATFDNTGGNGYVQITGGIANQLHEQTLPAFSMVGGESIRVWNDSSGNRPKISNLAAITSYSTGSSWNNEWGKIVVWRMVNKSGEYSPVMLNLPSDGYNSEATALADLDNYADYTIPNEFKSKAILVATFTFRISGGVITYGTGYQDLRGSIPIVVAGGAGGGAGGVTTWLALSDTPSTYTGQNGNVPVVNTGETGLEFEPKGRLWNASRTFFHELISTATANFAATFQNRDGIVAYLDDLTNFLTDAPSGVGLPFVRRDGVWFDTAQYTITLVDSNTDVVLIDMADQKQLVIRISSPTTSLAGFNSAVTNGRALIKEVVIENNTGVAIPAAGLIADVYENGLTSTYIFPIGETRIYYKYLNNKLFAGLSEVEVSDSDIYDISLKISDETSDLTNDNDTKNVTLLRDTTFQSITLSVDPLNLPTGSSTLVDVLVNNVTILTTPIELLASTSQVTITAPQISDATHNTGDVISTNLISAAATNASTSGFIGIKGIIA